MAFILYPIWRANRTVPLGRKNARRPALRTTKRGKGSSPTAPAASRKSTGCRSGSNGLGNLISGKAEIDFYRIMPPGGFRKGMPAALRKDAGEGDIPPETRGHDFFPYKPFHLSASPSRAALAHGTNLVQRILASRKYEGAVWTEGSPTNEETIYWLNLLIDTTLPICGNSAQRPQGQVSADGPKNIVDSIDYITSRVWADSDGRDRAGAVMIQEQQIFAARAVQKVDARPGGYVATGGHGGILGASGHDGRPLLHYLPTAKHTYKSDVKSDSAARFGARAPTRWCKDRDRHRAGQECQR